MKSESITQFSYKIYINVSFQSADQKEGFIANEKWKIITTFPFIGFIPFLNNLMQNDERQLIKQKSAPPGSTYKYQHKRVNNGGVWELVSQFGGANTKCWLSSSQAPPSQSLKTVLFWARIYLKFPLLGTLIGFLGIRNLIFCRFRHPCIQTDRFFGNKKFNFRPF